MTNSASNQKEDERSLLAAALQYAGRGWRVFPLVPRGKAPLTETGFKEATTDDLRIITWWERWPLANIGLATGDPFDVLDLDGETGHKNFKQHHKGYKHEGPVCKTGNGFHLYFAASGRRNGANLLPKIDFRGDGGYVVAPPSIHESGHRYEWFEDRGPDLTLPEPPDWLFTLTKKKTPPLLVKAPAGAVHPVQLAVEHGVRVYWSNPPKIHCPLGTHRDSNPSFTLYENGVYCFGCNTAMSPSEFKYLLLSLNNA